MVNLNLTLEDAEFLASQLHHRLLDLEDELIHTDKREIQHALAGDYDRLGEIEGRVNGLVNALRRRVVLAPVTGC